MDSNLYLQDIIVIPRLFVWYIFDSSLQAQFVDVISLNRYYGWYRKPSHPEVIHTAMSEQLHQWYETHHKPIIVTEYGAGAIAGLHKVAVTSSSCIYSTVYTEFQYLCMHKYKLSLVDNPLQVHVVWLQKKLYCQGSDR